MARLSTSSKPPSPSLAVFYHAYADGTWEEPLQEFLDALGDYDGPVNLGIVGRMKRRQAVRTAVEAARECRVVAEENEGYEQLTLAAVHEFSRTNDGAVLYAHTKGAARDYEIQGPWRREVTRQVVAGWRENLVALQEHDVVGPSWQTDWVPDPTGFPSNFWMARTDYLRTLPPPVSRRRTAAETWLGLGSPRVHDLAPHRMRWVPTDGRNVDGGRKIDVPSDQAAIMITENGEGVLAVLLVPREWLPEESERLLLRVLTSDESRAWRKSYERGESFERV